MKKLKNKVFLTIFLILTISIFSYIILFNTQNYLKQKQTINNTLNTIKNYYKNNYIIINENIKYMDSIIYTIVLDNSNNIKGVINHSNNQYETINIISLASSILKNNPKEKYIGYLYINSYSYLYIKNNILVILDNNNIKTNLINSLKNSITIFIILEIIVLIIAYYITKWIIKPVQESFEKQKQFIADASHELKTPLSVIIASSDALKENPDEKWIKNIQNEADRMNNLIVKLLDLTASEREIKDEFKIENLSKIIELSVLTFEGKAFEKNIKLNYKIKENINYKINSNDIKQLVEILLDNAIKHSYINETVNINLEEIGKEIILTVSNVGDEIPDSEQEKIFERFYRIDKSRNRNENRYGLGLAIAKNIVNNHNGIISASSKNNITTFKVIFKK